MPPRFAYWTIILEGQPTAFRAHRQEELLPTLRQLQARHPDAVLKWFARGKLWESPDEAMQAARGGERRSAAWRPGGQHRDPRDRFKVPRDEKRRRFAAKLRRDRQDQDGPRDNRAGAAGDRPARRPFRPASPTGRGKPSAPHAAGQDRTSARRHTGGRPAGSGEGRARKPAQQRPDGNRGRPAGPRPRRPERPKGPRGRR